MDDLIRREELLTSQYVHTECYLQENKDRHFDVYKKGWNDALQAVYDNAPAVDAVEVVRCKDCKYFELNHWDGPIITAHEICSKWGRGCKTYKDGYCFLGERKTDG